MSLEPVQPAPPERSALSGQPESPPTTAPLLLWLVVQLCAILLAALRVPLAAVYPEPAERLAPHLLLGVQVVAAGMLFPFLLRDRQAAVQVMATAIPFQLAAGYLGGFTAREMLPAIAFGLTWILVLAIWRRALPAPSAQLIGTSVATCLTLGGGILRYLRLEFGADRNPVSGFENASPLLTTFTAIAGGPSMPGWLLLAGIGAVAGGALAVRRYSRSRRRPAS